jgi:hypothetical protein
MITTSREVIVYAILSLIFGTILVQRGVVQGYLLFGAFGFFLLLFASYKINSMNAVTLYHSHLNKQKSVYKETATENTANKNMSAFLKSDLLDKPYLTELETALLESSTGYCPINYSDNTLVRIGGFVSQSSSSSKAVVSRYAYESCIKSGIYPSEKSGPKIMAKAAMLDFESFIRIKTAKKLSSMLPKSGMLTIVTCKIHEKSELNLMLCSFSRKNALALMLLESNRLVIDDISI